MTHDSIALGEDGPTHQPVETIASLRAIPNLMVFRPADGNECSAAYKVAVENRTRPTLIAFTRQGVPNLAASSIENGAKGGYIAVDCGCNSPDIILIGTGSEVGLCVDAAAKLAEDGTKVRVVSLPCWEVFDEQSDEYKESVLPSAVTKRLSVEAGISMGWSKYVGAGGASVSIETFGASAPGDKLMQEFGFTVENVVAKAKALLG
jgi:transketolase